MGTTVEKLNKVLQTKETIRTAINSKGGTLTESDTFSSYATAIDNIQTGSKNEPITITENGVYTAPEGTGYSPVEVNVGGDTFQKFLDINHGYYLFYYAIDLNYDNLNELNISNYKFTNCQNMFSNCPYLTAIPPIDVSNATVAKQMFYYDTALQNVPELDFSSATTLEEAFYHCESLISISLINTNNVQKMGSIFCNCESLENVGKLDTTNVSTGSLMFAWCYKVPKIDITKFPSSNFRFAAYCYSLKTLIIRTMDTIPTLDSTAFTDCYHFYGTKNTIYNPEGLKDGAIYVPDDKVESLKTATNWSVFADIIKPLSTYVEE